MLLLIKQTSESSYNWSIVKNDGTILANSNHNYNTLSAAKTDIALIQKWSSTAPIEIKAPVAKSLLDYFYGVFWWF